VNWQTGRYKSLPGPPAITFATKTKEIKKRLEELKKQKINKIHIPKARAAKTFDPIIFCFLLSCRLFKELK
jgi:hypothetical protein